MPLEQIFMPVAALFMLSAAIWGARIAGAASSVPDFPDFGATRAAPERSEIIDCHIERVDLDGRTLTVDVFNTTKTYQVTPRTFVSKDDRQVRLKDLSRGDYAVLQLASIDSNVVTRIQAISTY